MLVAVVSPTIHFCQVATVTFSISVCQAPDLMFVVLVLMMFLTTCGLILKRNCATGRVAYNATVQYMRRVQRHNKFKVTVWLFSTTIVEPIHLFLIPINNKTRGRPCVCEWTKAKTPAHLYLHLDSILEASVIIYPNRREEESYILYCFSFILNFG